MPAFTSLEFRRACGQFLTGVTIITTRDGDGRPVGLTANSFTSVSLEPPLVLVCLDKRLASYPAFQTGKAYAVHVLGEDQADLSTRFAMRGVDKFAGLSCREGRGGAPILPDYLALFECTITGAYDAGDHTIFIGQVERLDAPALARPPLGYLRGQYVHVQAERPIPIPDEIEALWALGWA